MARRILLSLVAATVAIGGRARAEPNPDRVIVSGFDDKEDLGVRQRSYVLPVVEILLGNLTVSVGAWAVGMPWGARDSDRWVEQLGTPWHLDEDMYSINQLAHPFGGSLSFSAARSTGHNFWVAGLYSIGSSMLWETVIENQPPSINDMITTSIGGMFIGEAVHRFGRALLYRGYGPPGYTRKATAAVLDPIGAANRHWWGDAWRKTVPPNMYAHFGVGYQQPSAVLGNRGGDPQFHTEVYVEHGLLGDRSFEPRRPLDHFELYAAVNAGKGNLEGDLYVRGVLLGDGVWREDVRGMYGLFGAYDYNNNDYVRASMLGVGPGVTAEVPLDSRGYIAGTLAAYVVPYGSAGGAEEIEGPNRDNHDGPGLAQIAELKGGQRGRFALKVTLRAYEIAGRLVGDEANEYVLQTTVGARYQVRRHHAIGVEATQSYERASFAEDIPTVMDTDPNRTTDFRVFYAVTTDEILGR